ncbi:hypothetical protein ACZ11_05210 [Lysinibacillus xylanilyticus]|uniref:AMP-dependent synthetase/ligase domain-containing protein n=1 Tax=Lysinibacillus xylanilyticus TaxID=582475 RepID=A0A0K9FBM0_9BACI|nr:hypothetical protein ACZ11_05210 [Lysinibacillus xylanilyticus]
MITHEAVSNTILDVNQRFGINSNDRMLLLSSLCFDLSVFDIFGAFQVGAALVLSEDPKNSRALIETI